MDRMNDIYVGDINISALAVELIESFSDDQICQLKKDFSDMNELNRKIMGYVIPEKSPIDHLLFDQSHLTNLVDVLTLEIKRRLEL